VKSFSKRLLLDAELQSRVLWPREQLSW